MMCDRSSIPFGGEVVVLKAPILILENRNREIEVFMTQRVNALVLRRPAVEAMTGLSRSTIYAMMAEGEFPRPLKLGKRAV